MPVERRRVNKNDKSNPHVILVYIRKEEENEIEMFDKLILQDPYLLKLKKEGELKTNRGFRSVMLMRLIKLYNKTHTYKEGGEDEEKEK